MRLEFKAGPTVGGMSHSLINDTLVHVDSNKMIALRPYFVSTGTAPRPLGRPEPLLTLLLLSSRIHSPTVFCGARQHGHQQLRV
jgi:hypothetical protein